jgi:hypothetical protein
MFVHKPARCPFGHALAPGRVLIGWTPCTCTPATEAAEEGRGLGHLVLHCRACEDDRTQTVFYEPPHDIRQQLVR